MAMAHYAEPDFQGCHWETANLLGAAAFLVSATQQDAPWPASDSRLERLGITTSAAAKILVQLSPQLEKTRELAKILFNK